MTEGAGDGRKPAIAGDPPSPLRIPAGCRFRTRCPMAQPRCEQEDPALAAAPDDPGHLAACHFAFTPVPDRSAAALTARTSGMPDGGAGAEPGSGRGVAASVRRGRDASPAKPRGPRLIDIAEAVGVHVSTVSRVLNGDPAQSVRPEVYRRILSTARQQGYRPNALARALKRRHTGAIAFVIPLLRNPIWVRLQRGALQRAGRPRLRGHDHGGARG